MTEDEARGWIEERFGADATRRVAEFLAMVVAENERQNLIAPSTLESIWVRHALDSAQLVGWARPGRWIDIGTGGGFPGMIAALLHPGRTMMVEPRRRRADFLQRCVDDLAIYDTEVAAVGIEKITSVACNLSARAVAPIAKLLKLAASCADRQTRWLLPRGTITTADRAFLRTQWHGVFHVKQSLTDERSSVLILDGG